jgi:phosphoribosylformylglycinamidine synthase I
MSGARVPAVVLAAPGTNRDGDVAAALDAAGAAPRIVTLAELRDDPKSLDAARLVVVAGGFSFADALGSGKLFALELADILGEGVAALLAAGRPVLGICNGFQTLVRLGLLPGGAGPTVLAPNDSGRFECRWVTLAPPVTSRCVWTTGLDGPLACPVAHGEGRFHAPTDVLDALEANGQVALRYAGDDGAAAAGAYPANPNGSAHDIAGVCDPTGLVLGLMPHPENHIHDWQHPRFHRGDRRGGCLPLFRNGVRHAAAS